MSEAKRELEALTVEQLRYVCDIDDCGEDVEHIDVMRCPQHGGECLYCGGTNLRRERYKRKRELKFVCNDCGRQRQIKGVTRYTVVWINGEKFTIEDDNG